MTGVTLSIVALVIMAWIALSLPLAVAVGRLIAVRASYDAVEVRRSLVDH